MKKEETISEQVRIKSKKAQGWFSSVSILSINQEKMWEAISAKLEHLDKRIITWFLAMTTSFTLLVATGLEYINYNLDTPKTVTVHEANKPKEIDEIPSFSQESELVPNLVLIERKNIQDEVTQQYRLNNVKPIPPAKKINHISSNSTILHPSVGLTGSINISTQRMLPALGVELQVFEWHKGDKKHSFKIQWQAQFLYQSPGESASNDLNVNHFISTNYEIENSKNKGWSIGGGYLLNPNGHIYINSTWKATALRRLNKHILLGPEVIFTDKFTKIMPSFTFVINS